MMGLEGAQGRWRLMGLVDVMEVFDGIYESEELVVWRWDECFEEMMLSSFRGVLTRTLQSENVIRLNPLVEGFSVPKEY
jgi:hypothetical protein